PRRPTTEAYAGIATGQTRPRHLRQRLPVEYRRQRAAAQWTAECYQCYRRHGRLVRSEAACGVGHESRTAMTPELVIGLGFALLIGLLLGAMGSGGSIITLPVLVYVAHIAPQSAVGMSMAIVGVTSAAAAYLYARK